MQAHKRLRAEQPRNGEEEHEPGNYSRKQLGADARKQSPSQQQQHHYQREETRSEVVSASSPTFDSPLAAGPTHRSSAAPLTRRARVQAPEETEDADDMKQRVRTVAMEAALARVNIRRSGGGYTDSKKENVLGASYGDGAGAAGDGRAAQTRYSEGEDTSSNPYAVAMHGLEE